jgi:hypothetical protein
MLSQGTADPLLAKAVVIEAGNDRLAIMGMDIGRGPTTAMMKQIRESVAEKAGVEHVMIAGSHTHHGPVIELTDREGFGKGKFDDAVAYAKRLPELLVEAIIEARNHRGQEWRRTGSTWRGQEKPRAESQSPHKTRAQTNRSDVGSDSI